MADTLESLEIEIVHSASGAATEIGKVTSSISKLSAALTRAIPKLNDFADALGKISSPVTINDIHGNSFNKTVQNLKQVASTAKSVKQTVSTPIPVSNGMQELISQFSEAEVLMGKLNGLQSAMQDAFKAGDVQKAIALRGQILQTQKAIDALSNSTEKATSKMGTLLASLKRIAMYRILRTIIKEITQAFKEGLENAYLFSAGIEGEGHRFAESLDRMKSATTQMKNQLGAAFAALLAAIEPILITLINLVISAANAISQLISAFTGTTYLKALGVSDKFADNMKKGAGGAKEWKNQLLGFDEINRLNEPSKGGGGGSTGIDPSTMFEDAPIAEFWLNLVDKVEPIITDIENMFNGLVDFITGVFTGDWKKAFEGLGTIVAGLGSTVNDVLNNVIVPTVDTFSQGIISTIDGLLVNIQDKTGIDLTKLRETILFFLNEVRFLIEGYCMKIGWIVEDLGLIVQDVMNGDWESAWEHAQLLVHDAQIDVTTEAALMAKGVTENMIEGKNSSQDFGQAFKDIMIDTRNEMGETGNKADELGKAFDSVITPTADNWGVFSNTIIGGALDQMGVLGSLANVVWGLVGAYDQLGGTTINANGHSHYSGKFADGGFPDEGSLFIARENGAELVGSIGGKTAVANNDDIVAAVSLGVYDAVSSAMSGFGKGQSVHVYLDSREIKAGQNRLARAAGV